MEEDMADVLLEKPASGETKTIACGPDDRYVIGFVPENSTLAIQGDDVIFSFDNGSRVLLAGYVKTYTVETAPDLLLPRDGAEIAGKDFWNAIFMEDLHPGDGLLQPDSGAQAPIGSDLDMGSIPDVMPPDDPALQSYVITMQSTGA